MGRWTLGKVGWGGAQSGTICINIDGPVTVLEGDTDVMPLDGSSVVASPADPRFVFDGVDGISVPGPDGDLFAIVDVTVDLTYTGGGDGGFAAMAYVEYPGFGLALVAGNVNGFRTIEGSTGEQYINEAGELRLFVENNDLADAGSLAVSGSMCLTWRIGE